MAPSLDLVLACSVAILPMQLILVLALGFRSIDSRALRAIFPASVELTVKVSKLCNASGPPKPAYRWLPHSTLSGGLSKLLYQAPISWRPHLLQPTLSALARIRLPFSKPPSFPIYHILVIIFHFRQARLSRYLDGHGTSDPQSLEKSLGT